MSDTPKILPYLRKSSKSDEKQAPSIPRQRAELLSCEIPSGFALGKEYVERESAKRPGRPVFNEMLRRIEEGEACGIVTWHPDRLARNATDAARIMDLLERGKIRVLKFASAWFENTPQGRFILMMAFAQSAHYSDALSVNTKSGLDRKVARGDFPGRARVGYLNDRRKKRIVIDSARAPIVLESFERYSTGSYTYDDIGGFFLSRGIGASNGRKPLSHDQVAKILSDPLYCGDFLWLGETHRGNHAPIVSRELFDRVQIVRTRRARLRRSAGVLKPFPFRRTLLCATCGSTITAETQKGHIYYRCSRKRKAAQRCAEPFVREEALDVLVADLLKPYALKAEWADEILARIEAERATAIESAKALIEANCLKIDTVNAALITLQDGLVDQLFDHDYVRTKRASLIGLRAELNAKNDELSSDATAWLEPFREFVNTARSIAETCSHGTKEARASLARKIFGSNLVLSCRKPRGVAINPWQIFADNRYQTVIVPLYDHARTFFQGHCRPAPDDPAATPSV